MQKIIDYFKSFGVDANTTATIFITLFTFSVGLFATWLAGQIKEAKERKSYRKSLLLILRDFSKTCAKQAKVVSASLDKAGLDKGNDFIINYIPIGTLDYLNKIDFTVFLKNFEPTFYKKKFSKAVSKLFSLIAQIKVQNDSIAGFSKMLFEDYRKHENAFYDNVDKLRQIHDELGLNLNGKPILPNGGELIQGYFKIFGDWQKAGEKTDMTSEQNELVLKILNINKQFQNVPLVLQTNDIALKADHAYINIVKIDTMLKNKFKDFIHFHRRANKVTDIIIKILE